MYGSFLCGAFDCPFTADISKHILHRILYRSTINPPRNKAALFFSEHNKSARDFESRAEV